MQKSELVYLLQTEIRSRMSSLEGTSIDANPTGTDFLGIVLDSLESLEFAVVPQRPDSSEAAWMPEFDRIVCVWNAKADEVAPEDVNGAQVIQSYYQRPCS